MLGHETAECAEFSYADRARFLMRRSCFSSQRSRNSDTPNCQQTEGCVLRVGEGAWGSYSKLKRPEIRIDHH